MTALFSLLLVLISAKADILIHLHGQNDSIHTSKKIFIFNEKVKRTTYVDLKETTPGSFEGRVKVKIQDLSVAESYRVGQAADRPKRYYAFSYQRENGDLILDLEPDQISLEEAKKSHPIDATPKPQDSPKEN